MNDTLYREMAERSVVANFVFNLGTGKFTYANHAMRSLFQTNRKSLRPDFIAKLIHPEDYQHAAKAFNDLQKEGLSSNIQFRITIDKEIKWVHAMAALNDDSQAEKLVYGSAIDITPTITSYRLLEKYANKKNAVLNVLAHDLVGPLNIAAMLGASLKSSNRDPNDLKLIDSILKINRQAIDLIRQLTEREFLETVESKLALTRTNISRTVKEYIEEYQKSTPDGKRNFQFSSRPDTIFLSVDEPKFIQVLNNLITNALKFTKEQGRITVRIQDKGDTVLFSVGDDGIGIPEKYQGVLFDKFTDASRTGLQGEPSIGMGMYVIKNIIEWHSGKVWVESKEGEGTTVYFTIPKA